MKIGLFPISAKPYHRGHDAIIRQAAKENDVLVLFVSLSDRKRKGEIPVLGEDMKTIWEDHIMNSLPDNVDVQLGGGPVRKLYAMVGEANETKSPDHFTIYSDQEDLNSNFPEKNMEKYFNDLWANGQITRKATSRLMSGTKMREFLANNDKDSFIANLPSGIDGEAIWNILSVRINEANLRSFVAEQLYWI